MTDLAFLSEIRLDRKTGGRLCLRLTFDQEWRAKHSASDSAGSQFAGRANDSRRFRDWAHDPQLARIDLRRTQPWRLQSLTRRLTENEITRADRVSIDLVRVGGVGFVRGNR